MIGCFIGATTTLFHFLKQTIIIIFISHYDYADDIDHDAKDDEIKSKGSMKKYENYCTILIHYKIEIASVSL